MPPFHDSDIALVTGAGSGIGRATCKLLALQGATVVATDVNKTAADKTVRLLVGKNHISLKLDVSKKSEVESVVAEVVEQFSSPPTILVNCAGLMLYQPLLDLTEDTYNRLFDVNVKGTILMTQAVCRELVAAKKKGSIVNIASIAKSGVKGLTLYGATKGAVEAFTMSAAKEFGPEGIRVNVISPGLIDTPMMSDFPDEINALYCQMNPMKRAGKPEEIAELIAFLVSEKSSYVNGGSVQIHGGQL